MVSQFVSPDKVRLLGQLDFNFPEGTHAIGRLDNHSEGLLILTTNKKVTKLLFESKDPHTRTYLVQVKNIVSEETLHLLRTGIDIVIEGSAIYKTTPCDVQKVSKPSWLYDGPFMHREAYPHSWLLITLTEGKFHQVRKMVAAAGHQCQRLLRVSIENIHLEGMQPGEVRELDEKDFFERLRIVYP